LLQLAEGARALGLGYIPSVANFLCVECPRPGAELYGDLLKEGVIVRPVGGYELPHHLRISVGTSEENNRCLETLAKVLA
jgi:histidinol-phosphate aminotransferase